MPECLFYQNGWCVYCGSLQANRSQSGECIDMKNCYAKMTSIQTTNEKEEDSDD